MNRTMAVLGLQQTDDQRSSRPWRDEGEGQALTRTAFFPFFPPMVTSLS